MTELISEYLGYLKDTYGASYLTPKACTYFINRYCTFVCTYDTLSSYMGL